MGQINSMRLPCLKRERGDTTASFYVKCCTILGLLVFSVIIVACGTNATTAEIGQPPVTVTINLNGANASPTPALPAYSCAAWVTNTTPSIGTSVVPVYAKFVHNVNGNPVGIGGANAQANVLWADGSQTQVDATTTSDGLAVFAVSIVNRNADLDKFTMVDVTFSAPGVPTCTDSGNRAAFFTLIVSSPAATTPTTIATQPGSTSTTTPGPTVTVSPSPTKCPKKHC
jgi:prepilin-type processing-associated H-X9-DG protein